MANGNPNNIRVGAGLLYFGAVGASEPTNLTDPWDAAFVPVGYTEEGHEASIEPSFEAIEVAEELVPIRYDETRREIRLSFSSAEMTASNIAKALNGGVIVSADIPGTTLGTVTFTDAGDLVTVSAPHGLAVDDRVVFGTITTTTGISAGVTYYVKTAPSTTTLTLSATEGGSTLALTTNGTSTSIQKIVSIEYTIEPPEIGDVTRIAIGWESADGQERWVYRNCVQVGSVAIARRKAPAKALIPMEFRVETDPQGEKPFKAIIGETL